MKTKKSRYELYLKDLLKKVRKEGLLVQTMPLNSDPFSRERRVGYSKYLGAVTVYNLFGRLTNIYEVYEDFDGFIKYFDYPQGFTQKTKKDLKTSSAKLTDNTFHKLIDVGDFERSFLQKNKGKLSMEETFTVVKIFEELDKFPASYDIGTVIDQLKACGPCSHCLNNGQSFDTCAAYCEYGRKLQLVMRGGK